MYEVVVELEMLISVENLVGKQRSSLFNVITLMSEMAIETNMRKKKIWFGVHHMCFNRLGCGGIDVRSCCRARDGNFSGRSGR